MARCLVGVFELVAPSRQSARRQARCRASSGDKFVENLSGDADFRVTDWSNHKFPDSRPHQLRKSGLSSRTKAPLPALHWQVSGDIPDPHAVRTANEYAPPIQAERHARHAAHLAGKRLTDPFAGRKAQVKFVPCQAYAAFGGT